MPSLCSGHPGRFYLSFVPSAQKKMIDLNQTKKLKADYKAAYEEAVLRIAELEAVNHQERVLTIQDYRNDFQRRLSIHDVEFAAAIRDVMEGFNNAKKVVELFPIK